MNKRDLLVSTQLGLQFALTVCIFGAAGWFIDKKFAYFPVFTIIFLVLGFALGMYYIIASAVKKGKQK